MSKAAAALLVPLLVLASCCFNSLSDDEVIFVSVGQGDCTHIRYRGRNFLIDGGGSEEYNVGENTVMPYLLRSGAGSVDIALATHLHTDHFKGIEELSAAYPVTAVGIPADYSDYADGSTDIGSRLFYVKPDTVICGGDPGNDLRIEVIWPVRISREALSPDDANEHNTVYMIHYGGVRVMVTGDLLEEDELAMVSYYKHRDPDALRCDVLKVAHHGSKSSTSEVFLDAVSPSVAVISVGRNNLYGHPHAQTLERLAARGIITYRTDIHGAIGLDIRNGKIRIDTFLQKDPFY